MPSFRSLFSAACLTAASAALPTQLDSRQATKPKTVLAPTAVFDIYPGAGSLAAPTPASGVHLETYDGASQVEQVLVFTGIPSTATECTFGWKQGDQPNRTFIVKGSNALATVRQLSGFPSTGQAITYDAVKPFDTATSKVGTPDFTNWDTLPAESHTAGNLPCSGTIYLKANLTAPDSNTKVFLSQDPADNGYFIFFS